MKPQKEGLSCTTCDAEDVSTAFSRLQVGYRSELGHDDQATYLSGIYGNDYWQYSSEDACPPCKVTSHRQPRQTPPLDTAELTAESLQELYTVCPLLQRLVPAALAMRCVDNTGSLSTTPVEDITAQQIEVLATDCAFFGLADGLLREKEAALSRDNLLELLLSLNYRLLQHTPPQIDDMIRSRRINFMLNRHPEAPTDCGDAAACAIDAVLHDARLADFLLARPLEFAVAGGAPSSAAARAFLERKCPHGDIDVFLLEGTKTQAYTAARDFIRHVRMMPTPALGTPHLASVVESRGKVVTVQVASLAAPDDPTRRHLVQFVSQSDFECARDVAASFDIAVCDAWVEPSPDAAMAKLSRPEGAPLFRVFASPRAVAAFKKRTILYDRCTFIGSLISAQRSAARCIKYEKRFDMRVVGDELCMMVRRVCKMHASYFSDLLRPFLGQTRITYSLRAREWEHWDTGEPQYMLQHLFIFRTHPVVDSFRRLFEDLESTDVQFWMMYWLADVMEDAQRVQDWNRSRSKEYSSNSYGLSPWRGTSVVAVPGVTACGQRTCAKSDEPCARTTLLGLLRLTIIYDRLVALVRQHYDDYA